MNVYLTGGTGYIGRSLVQALLRRGWQVKALVRRPESNEARYIQGLGAQLVQGDVSSRDSLRPGMQGADIVIHNAGRFEYGLTKPEQQDMKASNLLGTENVLGLAAELGAQRIVHVSSIVAHGRTGPQMRDETYQREYPYLTFYEETKAEAHQVAQRYLQQGAPVMMASPAGVFGPGDHSVMGYYARLYVRGFGMPLLPSKGGLSVVHVDDCAEGIALVAEKGRIGEEYIMSAGALSMRETFEIWKTTPGGPRFMIWLPRGIGSVMTRSMEIPQRLLGLPNIFSREVFQVGSDFMYYSGEKAVRELGACFRDPRQVWLDTLEAERERMKAGKSWRYIGP